MHLPFLQYLRFRSPLEDPWISEGSWQCASDLIFQNPLARATRLRLPVAVRVLSRQSPRTAVGADNDHFHREKSAGGQRLLEGAWLVSISAIVQEQECVQAIPLRRSKRMRAPCSGRP